ncbi:MAG: MgtC/SapB family protein [Defluviitaleaceae bacterium]|nr:MgtC/SapB family protein [Defluviitaleaceae bacterium]
MTLFDFAVRISCAVLFGFLIGLERQLTSHSMAIRINVLISIGACLFSIFSQLMGVADTTRVAAQVVTGIGFLCSGIMFKEGLNVKGLNTAATMWCTAAIGVLTSSGFILHASVAVAILICSNLIFRFVGGRIQPFARFDEEEHTYILSVTCGEDDEPAIRSAIISNLRKARLRLINLESADEIGNKVEIEARMLIHGRRSDEYIERLTMKVALEKGVIKAGWKLM